MCIYICICALLSLGSSCGNCSLAATPCQDFEQGQEARAQTHQTIAGDWNNYHLPRRAHWRLEMRLTPILLHCHIQTPNPRVRAAFPIWEWLLLVSISGFIEAGGKDLRQTQVYPGFLGLKVLTLSFPCCRCIDLTWRAKPRDPYRPNAQRQNLGRGADRQLLRWSSSCPRCATILRPVTGISRWFGPGFRFRTWRAGFGLSLEVKKNDLPVVPGEFRFHISHDQPNIAWWP